MSDAPEPDLFIRTGGEQRISNFMLWQLAYTELYFTDTLWPAFDRNALARQSSPTGSVSAVSGGPASNCKRRRGSVGSRQARVSGFPLAVGPRSMLKQRIATAVALVVLFIAADFLLSTLAWGLLLLIPLALGAWEWSSLAKFSRRGRSAFTVVLIGSCLALLKADPAAGNGSASGSSRWRSPSGRWGSRCGCTRGGDSPRR